MKTKLEIFLFVLIILSTIPVLINQVHANGWHSNYPSLPGSGPIYGHATAVLGDTLYVAGGSSNGIPSNTLFRYSISGNTWSAGNTMPGVKTGGDLVSANGKVYYIGGGSHSLSIASLEQYVYDPSTGLWSAIADIPVPVTGNTADSYNESLIYCIMGGWSSFETIIQVYNIELNSWSRAAEFPKGSGRRTFAGAIMGNKIFVCGGYDGSFRSDFWIGIIDPSNCLKITWQQMPGLSAGSSRPGGTAINGKFYVVLGELPDGTGSDMTAVWDTESAAWTYIEGKPTRTNNLYASVSSSIEMCNGSKGVKVWVVGGSIENQTNRPMDVFTETGHSGRRVNYIDNNSPIRYDLKQNYPNPFNPVTKIDFSIPENSHVKLSVFDITGKEVALLTDEHMKAGNYRFFFDGSEFASGVYFYKILTTGFIDCKKMLLVK